MADLIDVTRARQCKQLVDVDGTILATLITVASTMIEMYCHREFTSEERTETYNGDGDVELLLNMFPVTALSEVIVVEDDETETTIDGGEFRINGDLGLIKFKPDSDGEYTYFPIGFQNIKPKYTAGWVTIPATIQEGVAQSVAWLYNSGAKDASLVYEQLGDYSMKREESVQNELPRAIRMLVSRYKDHRLGT